MKLLPTDLISSVVTSKQRGTKKKTPTFFGDMNINTAELILAEVSR